MYITFLSKYKLLCCKKHLIISLFLLLVECVCDGVGALDLVCDQLTGQCNCGFEFSGEQCDECQKGYFSYPDCDFCDCDTTGTEDDICDANSGQCLCKENYTGDRCDKCAPGFYSYPECLRKCFDIDDSTFDIPLSFIMMLFVNNI